MIRNRTYFVRILFAWLPGLILASCSIPAAVPALTAQPKITLATPALTGSAAPTGLPAAVPSATAEPVVSSLPTIAATPLQTHQTIATVSPPPQTAGPDDWQALPVVPAEISAAMRQVYAQGLEAGNNPHAFSKVGDCGSTPSWFLGDFDRGSQYYQLGDYQNLSAVITQFKGSFARTSLAAKSGFNASSVFTPLWADRSQCAANETPLACEYHLNRPSLALITLGTNDVWHKEEFEPQMRAIIEYSLQHGVIPVLATKADNDEGDGSINATIARLAQEYHLPLWNFWRAVQLLPNHGLQPDGAHITWGPNRFNDPQAMTTGWTIRNLTALQVLEAVWSGVANPSP